MFDVLSLSFLTYCFRRRHTITTEPLDNINAHHYIGAVLISLVIIYRWVGIISEQVKKIVGHTAPPAYIEMVSVRALFGVV